MENLALLIGCFLAGVVLRRFRLLPEDAPATLNAVILHLSLPALVVLHLQRLRLDASLLVPILAPWLLFALGLVFFTALRRVARWSPATTGGLILSGSLANTSFVGLPMIEAFYGASFLSVGILMDQLGTYLILSTLGILVVALFSPDAPARPTARSVLRKIIRFPPLIALVAGLALADVPLPGPATAALERIGATLAPLALLSVGFQLRLADAAGRGSALAAGLLFKLVLGPLLVVAILVGLLGAEGPTIQVAAFEVAMASQIGGAIVASQNRLDPPLVTLMVALGIPLSFLTLPVWWLLLQGL